MNINKLAAPMGVAVIAIGVAVGPVGPASAADNIKPFGHQESLNEPGTGAPMIGYTVEDLMASSAAVPHDGQLYEATLTVDSTGAAATPLIPMFNARAQGGELYRVIANAGPESVPPGGSSTGKLYFDVVGEVPNSVVYNDGFRDLLAWVPGAPEGGTRP